MTKNEVIEYLVTKIEDEEEPLFLLRGRDMLASSAVMKWCEMARSFQVPKSKIDSAEILCTDMIMYPGKRLPD